MVAPFTGHPREVFPDEAPPPAAQFSDFQPGEYDARRARAHAAMTRAGIDVLVSVDPANMAWLTGYDGWSFYVPQCVLIGPEGEPVWFGRQMDAAGARRTAFIPDGDILTYSDDYVHAPDRHPMDRLAEIVEARGWSALRIGVEMDSHYFTAAAHGALARGLPNAVLIDATGLVNWCRAVKSRTEISYIRRAARIVEATHARIFEMVEPGVRKNDVVAEIYRCLIAGDTEYGGDYPAIAPMLPSGADASAAHLTWDDRPFRDGEGTFFEIAGCYRRYHCPQSRTVFLGKPPREWLDTERIVLEGIEAALEAARPGETCQAIEAAWRRVINAHGLEKTSRCGYSIGLGYPPDWGERTMSLRPGDETVLEPNMCFHLIPAIWCADWGLEITESFRITETGAELFCATPRKLMVKD